MDLQYCKFQYQRCMGSLRLVSLKTLINFSNTTIIKNVKEDDVDLGDLFKLASSSAKPNSHNFLICNCFQYFLPSFFLWIF